MICAPLRMAPMSEYLLLLLHPASRMPTTPMEEMARKKKTPTLKSMMCAPLFQGRQLKVTIEAVTTRKGARLWRKRSLWRILIISFVSILNTSLNTWRRPHLPTRIGPRRHWKNAHTLRSM